MPENSGATWCHRRTRIPHEDTTASKSSRFLDLPLELRHYIYAYLIYPGIPGSRSALTVTTRQLRKEVHDWLVGQKFIIHVGTWQHGWLDAWPWYAPILKRATNVEFDLSCLPGYPSYPMLDTFDLPLLWHDECHLKQVSFTVLDDSAPSGSEEILCGGFMHPLRFILARHKVPHAHISTNRKQSSSRLPREDHLPVQSAAIDIRRSTISSGGLLVDASLAGHFRLLDALLQVSDSLNTVEIQSATKPVSSIDLIYRLLSTSVYSLQTRISNIYAAALDYVENGLR